MPRFYTLCYCGCIYIMPYNKESLRWSNRCLPLANPEGEKNNSNDLYCLVWSKRNLILCEPPFKIPTLSHRTVWEAEPSRTMSPVCPFIIAHVCLLLFVFLESGNALPACFFLLNTNVLVPLEYSYFSSFTNVKRPIEQSMGNYCASAFQ